MPFIKTFRVALIFSFAAVSLAAQNYTFQTIAVPWPTPNYLTFAGGINDAGTTVGTLDFTILGQDGLHYRGFLRHPDGTFAPPIVDPDETNQETFADAINDSGTIVGSYLGADGNFHGFLDNAGTFSTVDALSGPSTEVWAINNAGDFVGVTTSYTLLHGFVSSGGVITQIDVPGTLTGTQADGIDDTGTIVGCAGFPFPSIAYIRGPLGDFHTFQIPHSTSTCANGVRSGIGTIIGNYCAGNYCEGGTHGFIYKFRPGTSYPAPPTEGAITVFDYPGAIDTYPIGINGHGQITGNAITAAGARIIFIATPTADPTPPAQ